MRSESDDSADAKRSDTNSNDDKKEISSTSRHLPKLTAVGEEMKKIIKWFSFAKSNVSFGFQHLPPVCIPLMTEARHGFAVYFDKISGWNIPNAVIKSFEHDSKKDDFEIIVQLSLSLYQISTSTFFGSTWMSPSVSLGSSKRLSSNIVEFDCNDIIYMITRIVDPSCVAIVEIVVSKLDSNNMVIKQYG
jgi:hypothetical protein